MHAISKPDFMKGCLIEIRLAAGQNDYILELLAYLEDKVAFLEGRPQIYGTHTDWMEGELKATPIEDISRIDLRRKGVVLPPISEVPHNKGKVG